MNSLIQFRIARDILVMFIVSLFVLTMLVLFIGVVREAFNQGLGFSGVLRLIPYAAPNALSLAVPGTALFSVCCVYGRMSSDNEFVAMQSVGISPLPAVLPAVVITIALSIATVGLINAAFTWGFHGVRKVVMSSVENLAYGLLERDRRFQHGSLSLMVRDVQGRDLIEPAIKINRVNQPPISINARTAQLSYNADDESLTLRITEGDTRVGDQTSFSFPDTFEHSIALDSTPAYDLLTANPSHMPMSDIPRAVVRQEIDIRQQVSAIAVHTGFALMTSRPDRVVDQSVQKRMTELTQGRKRLHRLDAEMHRRWASGFTCFALAMVGIPFAIRMKTSDTMTIFGTVFLPTLLVYYPLFALTLDMAKDGRIAAYGVWGANALFVVIGVLMTRRTIYRPA